MLFDDPRTGYLRHCLSRAALGGKVCLSSPSAAPTSAFPSHAPSYPYTEAKSGALPTESSPGQARAADNLFLDHQTAFFIPSFAPSYIIHSQSSSVPSLFTPQGEPCGVHVFHMCPTNSILQNSPLAWRALSPRISIFGDLGIPELPFVNEVPTSALCPGTFCTRQPGRTFWNSGTVRRSERI